MTAFGKILGVAALGLFASVGGASAATINFSDGAKIGDTYQEKGFTFEYVGSGSVSTPDNCEAQDGTKSDCLLLPNATGKTVKMTYSGGLFSLLSFTFDGKDGEDHALWVSRTATGTDQLFSEALNASKMSPSGQLTLFNNVTELYFRTASKGSARVDDLRVDVVPLPAAGLLLIAGLGGLAVMRRRKF